MSNWIKNSPDNDYLIEQGWSRYYTHNLGGFYTPERIQKCESYISTEDYVSPCTNYMIRKNPIYGYALVTTPHELIGKYPPFEGTDEACVNEYKRRIGEK